MTSNDWTVIGILAAVVLALIGLGFAAMSTNAPFVVPVWVPYVFFALAVLALIALIVYICVVRSKKKQAKSGCYR
jgi:membrane protein implicated in regulation of membrane protease activity